MKNLFIDSNVWLSLYHFTNDDLAQFGKLKEILGQDKILYRTIKADRLSSIILWGPPGSRKNVTCKSN